MCLDMEQKRLVFQQYSITASGTLPLKEWAAAGRIIHSINP